MRLLFITTHNLATNPRLVKEMRLALQHNDEVEVICYIFRNWSDEMNHKMLQEFQNQGVKFHCIEAGKKNLLQWFISVSKEKSARLLSRIVPLKNAALANAVSRRNVGLLSAVTKIAAADWVIGHNPGALWATRFAGESLKCKMGFDVEDYHPGEGDNVHLQEVTNKLMQQVLPKMDYVSFAAPLIMQEVQKDLNYSDANWFTILNYFPADEFVSPETIISGPLKLVWFSQQVSFNRGLEQLIPLIEGNPDFELHLFGNSDEDFEKEWLAGHENIIVHAALPQKELHKELAGFDIGLALEPGKDLNNELAVSNKMLAYFQAGLYLLASDTKAQKQFIERHPAHGRTTGLAQNEFNDALNELIQKKELVRGEAERRFESAKKCCWEEEGRKLVDVWYPPSHDGTDREKARPDGTLQAT